MECTENNSLYCVMLLNEVSLFWSNFNYQASSQWLILNVFEELLQFSAFYDALSIQNGKFKAHSNSRCKLQLLQQTRH